MTTQPTRAGTGGVDLVVHEGVLREKRYWQTVALHYEGETGRLRRGLQAAIRVAGEANAAWLSPRSGTPAGKLLAALAGLLPGHRADIDEIHAAIAGTEPVAMVAGDLGLEGR